MAKYIASRMSVRMSFSSFMTKKSVIMSLIEEVSHAIHDRGCSSMVFHIAQVASAKLLRLNMHRAVSIDTSFGFCLSSLLPMISAIIIQKASAICAPSEGSSAPAASQSMVASLHILSKLNSSKSMSVAVRLQVYLAAMGNQIFNGFAVPFESA